MICLLVKCEDELWYFLKIISVIGELNHRNHGRTKHPLSKYLLEVVKDHRSSTWKATLSLTLNILMNQLQNDKQVLSLQLLP